MQFNTLLKGFVSGVADNHLHLALYQDPLTVVEEFINWGGVYLLDVAVKPAHLQVSKNIKRKFKDVVYVAFGIHPEYLKPAYALAPEERNDVFKSPAQLQQAFLQVFDPKLVDVIGEVGLDLYRVQQPNKQEVLSKQEEVFAFFIKIAQEYNKPLMLHLRGVDRNDFSLHTRALEILKDMGVYTIDDMVVYFHSYTGYLELAKKIIDKGFYLGFNGIATYSSAAHLQEVIKLVPWSQLLVETDAPFLTPNLGVEYTPGGIWQYKEQSKNHPIWTYALNKYFMELKNG